MKLLNGMHNLDYMEKYVPKFFVLDVDGVLTDGGFYYTESGKMAKKFGADDNDALSLLRPYMDIVFVTGDKRGFEISNKRVSDMHFKLELVSTIKRIEWIKERYDPRKVVYMGDGIFDHYVMREVGYSIATGDADSHAKKYADYVCDRIGGKRAVAEACLHLLDRFFVPYDETRMPEDNINYARDWTV